LNSIKWDKLTAKKYEQYARKYPMYRKTSQLLVKLANIEKGMTVIDLCCGTGIATKEILKKIGTSGKVIGVDSSKEMLAIAKKKFRQKNAFFIQSSEEEIDKKMKEKADIVLCNSAFWQMYGNKALETISNILKDDGKFAFNLPNQIYNIDSFLAPEKSSIISIMRKIRLEKMLASNFFKIIYCKALKFRRTAKDKYEFLKIPIMTKRMFPNLDYSERLKILNKAYRTVSKSRESNDKWIYFVVKKQKTYK